MPTPASLLKFFTHQLFVGAVAWTAGLVAAGVVRSLFEVKGLRNLWGLSSSGSRVLVSSDDYRAIMMCMSFVAGLVMMIFVRHFLLRWIEEIRALRVERATGVTAPVGGFAAGTPTP